MEIGLRQRMHDLEIKILSLVDRPGVELPAEIEMPASARFDAMESEAAENPPIESSGAPGEAFGRPAT